MKAGWGFAIVILSALLVPNASAATAHPFPLEPVQVYMARAGTALPAPLPVGGNPLLLQPIPGTSAAIVLFLAPGVSLPVPLGLVGQQTENWTGLGTYAFDMLLKQ